MGLLDRLLGHARTDAETTKRPLARPRPAGIDRLPPTAEALVVYALEAADDRPDGRTPCMVVLDFDPVDVRALLGAGPALQRDGSAAFRARLDASPELRDPNSRGRLAFVRRWLADHDPPHVGWRLEPAATAGSGAAEPG